MTQPIADDLRVLSIRAACKALGITPHTIYQIIERGDIRTVQLGANRGVPVREINRFLDGGNE